MGNNCPNKTPAVVVVDSVNKVMPLTREESAIKALYETTGLLQLHPGSSVNSREYRALMEGEVNRLAKQSYERHGKVVNVKELREATKFDVKKQAGGYKDGMVDRKGGKRPSYYQREYNSDSQKRKKSEYDWNTVGRRGSRGRGLKAGVGSMRAEDNYDFFEDTAGISSANKFNSLRKDLALSEDDYYVSD